MDLDQRAFYHFLVHDLLHGVSDNIRGESDVAFTQEKMQSERICKGAETAAQGIVYVQSQSTEWNKQLSPQ